MKILKQDFDKMHRDFNYEHWGQGMRFVLAEQNTIARDKQDFAFFFDSVDAERYRQANTTKENPVVCFDVKGVCRTMSEAMINDSYMIVEAGIVNLGEMVDERYDRIKDENLQRNKNELKEFAAEQGFEESLDDFIDQISGNDEYYSVSIPLDHGENASCKVHFETHPIGILISGFEIQINGQAVIRISNLYGHCASESLKASLFDKDKPKRSVSLYTTVREAWNLAMGRAVLKPEIKESSTGKAYLIHSWKKQIIESDGKVNPNHFIRSVNYNLNDALEGFPILELQSKESETELLTALKEGSLVPITVSFNGYNRRFFIEANPKAMSVNFYDSKMKPKSYLELKAEISKKSRENQRNKVKIRRKP